MALNRGTKRRGDLAKSTPKKIRMASALENESEKKSSKEALVKSWHFNEMLSLLQQEDRIKWWGRRNIHYFARRIFTSSPIENTHSAFITWPCISGQRQFLISFVMDPNNSLMSFHHCHDGQVSEFFLQFEITKSGNIENIRMPENLQGMTVMDCEDIVSFFRSYFSRPEKKSKQPKENFAKLLEDYREKGVIQRMKFLIDSSKKISNQHVFWLDWKTTAGTTCSIKIALSPKLFAFNSLTEKEILNRHYPDRTSSHNPLNHWLLTASEDEITLLLMFFTLDLLVANLQKVHRGHKMSGTDVMNLRKYFDDYLRIQTTYLYDDADSKGPPLRVSLPIARGKTWYMSNANFKLLSGQLDTTINGQWPQDEKLFEKTVETLQRFPLAELPQLCESLDKAEPPIEAKRVAEEKEKKREKREKREPLLPRTPALQHLTTFFAPQKMTTLQQLVQAVIHESKTTTDNSLSQSLRILLRCPDVLLSDISYCALLINLYGARIYVCERNEAKEKEIIAISPGISPS